jgi:hypothetical protein
MAVLVLKDATITINSVALADHANSVTVNYEIDSVEVTAFGSGGHTFTGGLQNNSVTINFNQDFAATKVHATLTGLVGVPTTVVVRPTSAIAAAGTNPDFTLTSALCSEYRPVMGAVGDLATVGAITFQGGLFTETV